MKKYQEDEVANQFKKMIKDVIATEGYFKEKDVNLLMTNILSEIDKLIAKQVKKHFYEIGHYMIKDEKEILTKKAGDKKDA